MEGASGAAIVSLISASSLLIGSAIGLVRPPSKLMLGLVLAFGAGALFSAASFDLVAGALERGNDVVLALGMLLGACTFVVGSRLMGRRGDGGTRRSDAGDEESADAREIVLGATLDGIPESLAIGASMVAVAGTDVAIAWSLPVAVALSNLPEALGATVGLRAAGHRPSRILGMWGALVLASGAAAAIGYVALDTATDHVHTLLDAFTAGAVLAMLADTMIPEAYSLARRRAGIATVLGFTFAVLIG